MALPADVSTRQVHDRRLTLLGDPRAGHVRFIPTAERLVHAATSTTITGTAVRADYDADGEILVTLPCTNDPDLTGGPFSYLVEITLIEPGTGKEETPFAFWMDLPPSEDPLELADVTPILPAEGGSNLVFSVNGQTGIVVLSPADIGAEASGAANTAIAAHVGSGDPHPQYLTSADGAAAYDALGSAAAAAAASLAKTANLSDLASAAAARTNLGLGGAAVLNVGTTAGTVAAGDDPRLGGGGGGSSVWISAADYGAVSDGVTDDSAAIQDALDAALPNQTVFLPGNHAIGTALSIPPMVTLRSHGGGHAAVSMTRPTLIGLPGLTVAALLLVDQATGGYATVSDNARIIGLTVELNDVTTGTVDGIQAQGAVGAVFLQDVQIRNAPRDGIRRVTNGSGSPQNWHATRVHIASCGGVAFDASMADSRWHDCEALGAGTIGWQVLGAANTVFVDCRAEWSGTHNWHLGGDTGDWQGSGGYSLIGCASDSASQNGVYITSAGKAPIMISGFKARRDGYSSGAAGYAAVKINGAAAPIIIDGLTVYPGPNDDGGGINRPQYGLSVTGATSVSYSNAHLHAATAGYHDGGTNARVLRGSCVVERVGTMSTYTELVSNRAPGAAFRRYADLALTNNTVTAVPLASADHQDGGTWWTTGANITVPSGAGGRYLVYAKAVFKDGVNTGDRSLWVRKLVGGPLVDDPSVVALTPGATGTAIWPDISATGVATLTAGETYYVSVRQGSGGALTLYGVEVSFTRLPTT